jgi:hypothetical protein
MKKSSVFLFIILFAFLNASSLPGRNQSITYSPTSVETMRSNLYQVETNGSTTLLDGDLTQYDPSFSNAVDGMDARKMSNFSENLGMVRGNTTLVIERRHTIEGNDSIFYKMWNMQQKNYQLEFLASNLNQPGLSGYIEDSYLHTSTPINLNSSNYINFSVNGDTASSAMYRFRIVFTTVTAGVLPLTFTSVNAWQLNNAVTIDWETANENNMKEYSVEKSSDGNHFLNLADINANNFAINKYSYTDAFPSNGYNYYRILSTDINGATKYSQVMNVFSGKGFSEIKVFPNPVTGNKINLQMVNQPVGIYNIRLINSFGQSFMASQLQHPGGSSTETISPSQNIPKGIYHLEVTEPGGRKINISLVY